MALSTQELRGLAHEVGQRLVEQSLTYHARLKELQRLQDSMGFKYFGLSAACSEKELDAAYRALAKKMHPDKNGGTEEAKQRFQVMRERYEKLKNTIRAGLSKENDYVAEGAGDEDASGASAGAKDHCAETMSSEHGGQILDGESGEEQEKQGQPHRSDATGENDGEGNPQSKTRSALSYDPFDRDSTAAAVSEMLQQLTHIRPQMEKVTINLRKVMQDSFV